MNDNQKKKNVFKDLFEGIVAGLVFLTMYAAWNGGERPNAKGCLIPALVLIIIALVAYIVLRR